MDLGIICQNCGIEAPSKYVEFHQNIGALVVRWGKSYKGHLCKRCLHKQYWSMTSTTAVAGWWGTISFVLTPCFIVNNTARYVAALGMPGVPEGAVPPVVTDDVARRVGPQIDAIFKRLNNQEKLEVVAHEFAPKCGVTPGQIVRYIQLVARNARQNAEDNKPTGGFPVMPALPIKMPPPLPAIPIEDDAPST